MHLESLGEFSVSTAKMSSIVKCVLCSHRNAHQATNATTLLHCFKRQMRCGHFDTDMKAVALDRNPFSAKMNQQASNKATHRKLSAAVSPPALQDDKR